jgi:hypothetical protein
LSRAHCPPAQIRASECVPNPEHTENEFGKPARIALAINATGKFNPSTGVVSFTSTERTPASSSGGAPTDVVDGTLHGSG